MVQCMEMMKTVVQHVAKRSECMWDNAVRIDTRVLALEVEFRELCEIVKKLQEKSNEKTADSPSGCTRQAANEDNRITENL